MYKPEEKKADFWDYFFPWIGSVILLPILIFYVINRGEFTFLDYVNLLIHEGGHGVLKWTGEFIYTLGGTLMQTVIPLMFVILYIVKRNVIAFQLALFWLGENMMNVSVYAADAVVHKLPLLGGSKVYHDWTFILGKLDMLDYAQEVGDAFYYCGVLCFILVLLAPLYIKKRERSESAAPELNL